MKDTFVSSNGAEIKIRPVPMLALQMVRSSTRKELVDSGIVTPLPTYTVETDIGTTEEYNHDETTLETPEDKLSWELYQAGQQLLQAATVERTVRMLLTKGVDVPPMTDEQEADWRSYGIEFSQDADTRYMEYLNLEYLPTPQDMRDLTQAILRLSQTGAPKEQIDAVEAMFRRPMA